MIARSSAVVQDGIQVRVGIVSWNTSALLDRCLAALPAALGDLDAEVVVVDNASSDDSPAVAARHPVRVIVNEQNVGYARAMNQALTSSPGADVLIALNPDTEAPPGSLALLVERLLEQPDVGLVAPRLTGPDGALQHSAYRFPSALVTAVVSFVPTFLLRHHLGRRFWLEGFSDHRDRVDVDWAIGAVHVIRREALRSEPPYDETWFMYAEDIELCWRLRRAGWAIRLEGDVAVAHVGNAAGAQAWGSDRTVRWLVPTLHWYGRDRGAARLRGWAAINVAGYAYLRAKWRLLARLHPQRFAHLAHWAAEAAAPAAVHREVVKGGVAAVAHLAPAGQRRDTSEPPRP